MVDSTNLPDVDINQIATDLNGKMDRDGVNATASVCIESYHDNNGNWYRVYSDGWCEQGGYKGSTSANSTVNLFKNYKDTSYSIQTMVYGNYENNASPCYNKTTSSFITYQNVPVYWEAKGYIR